MESRSQAGSDSNNPYIQIMFNIKSKNVVNNNMLPEQGQAKYEIPHHIKQGKRREVVTQTQRKNKEQSNKHLKKSSDYDIHQQTSKPKGGFTQDLHHKGKKKNTQTKPNFIVERQPQKQQKRIKPKRKCNQPLKVQLSQENRCIQRKKYDKSVIKECDKATKAKNNKEVRQKIIELMIKDYEKGVISMKNLKQAIQSLIQEEGSKKRNVNKSQIKTQKSKSHFNSSYRNSLATSLKNTPRHKPSKSRSQKFYHPQISQNLRLMQNEQRQPQIQQRVIERKQFVNKIIIKGINTSLFLSNEITQKQSPSKNPPINMAIINTSDSVKELRKQMQKAIICSQTYFKQTSNDGVPIKKQITSKTKEFQDVIGVDRINGKELNFKKVKRSENKQAYTKSNCYQEYKPLTVSENQKQNDITTFLSDIMHELEEAQKHKLTQARLNFAKKDQNNTSQEESSFIIKQEPVGNKDSRNKQVEFYQRQFDEFYIREDDSSSSQNYSKIQELQRQYQFILSNKLSDSKEYSNPQVQSNDKEGKQYDNKQQSQNNLIQNKNEMSKSKQYNKDQHFGDQLNFKTYFSSELQANKKMTEDFMQQLSSKKEKQETVMKNKEIKKLNEILDLVKHEINKGTVTQKENQFILKGNNQYSKAFCQKNSQNMNPKDKIQSDTQVQNANSSHFQILNKIVQLLQNDRKNKINQLKFYQTLNGSQKLKQSQQKSKHADDQAKRQYKVLGIQLTDKTKHKSQLATMHEKIYTANELAKQNDIEGVNSFKKKLNSKLRKKEKKFEGEDLQIKSVSSISNKSNNSANYQLHRIKISQLNLDYIEVGLRKRQLEIHSQREQQLEILTEKFINDKVTPKHYQQEKGIIDKWHQLQVNQLRKAKLKLLQGYKKAKRYIDEEEAQYSTNLSKEKSYKMIKSISQKYLQQSKSFDEGQNANRHIIKNKKKASKVQKQRQALLSSHQLLSRQRETSKKQNKQEENFQINKLNQLVSKKYHQFQKKGGTIIPSDEKNNGQKEELQTLSKQQLSPCYLSSEKSSELVSEQTHSKQSQSAERQLLRSFGVESDAITLGEKQDLKQRQKNKKLANIHSQISQFLQKYQNDIEDEDQGQESQLGESQLGYNEDQDYLYQTQLIEKLGAEQAEDIYEQETKVQYNLEKTQLLSSELINYQDNLLEEPDHVIINKKEESFETDLLFSPQKTPYHSEFSEQLQSYPRTISQKQSTSLQYFHNVHNAFDENADRLSSLTEEDKDDIFEFIFLDLCLQLFLEQTKNNKIMKAIEKHIVYLRKKRKIPKGFKSGLVGCKHYIQNFVQYIKSNHFSVLKRLETPMGPSAKQMLKFMRDYDENGSQASESEGVNLILPIQIYEKYEHQPVNKLIVEKYYDDEEKEDSRLKFLNSLKHIHNKSMFDSLNQSLDLQRNYGIWGKPFPWKKNLNVDREYNNEELTKKIQQGAQKVIQNCSFLCGVLVDKEDSVFGKANVSEQYLKYIREDRISKMLSNEMYDNEQRWIFYDDEQTQVLIQITKFITKNLMEEVISDLKVIKN